MKHIIFSMLVLSTPFVLGCRQPADPQSKLDPDRIILDQAYFNQSNTAFKAPHVEKLVELWRTEMVKQLVNFTVVNDQKAYEEAFRGVKTSLPTIDFTQNTLLIGRRGQDYTNGPANIKRMSQSLNLVNGEWRYSVTVTHRSTGGEWFGFTRLVPRIADPSTIKLIMDYQLEP